MLFVTCVVLNYNDAKMSVDLAMAIKKYSTIKHVVIVDNCSTDNSWSTLSRLDDEKIICIRTERNGGYGYGNNYAARYALDHLNSDAVLIVNPDVAFNEELTYTLIQAIQQDPSVGVASAIQLDRNGCEIKRSAWRIPTIWEYIISLDQLLSKLMKGFYYSLEELHKAPIVPVDCVAGSLLMITREAFEATKGYDEEMFLYCEETTLGCKIKKAGYRTVLCSDVSYKHLHGASISKSIQSSLKQRKILLQSHHLLLKKYLKANRFQLMVDTVVGQISLLQEAVKNFIRVPIKNKCFAKEI